MPPLPIEDYHVGIICALHSEMAAVEAMLDEEHKNPVTQDKHDHNTYAVGRIHTHNVVIACLPAGVDGLTAAATSAKDMSRTFGQLRFGLLVGIGGGIPDVENGVDIQLGDIVVSEPAGTTGGVVQYDKGKVKDEGEWERKGMLNAPPTVLLTAVQKLKAQHLRLGSKVSELIENMLQQYPNMAENGYARPTATQITLNRECQILKRKEDTEGAIVTSQRVPQLPRPNNEPKIHYGIIASSNQVVKDAVVRDRLRRECGALCVEMEAAGLMNDFPCLVIRGICDYADKHKDDRWHKYAAAAAAAYAKELLMQISAEQTSTEKPVHQILGCLDEHFEQFHAYHNLQETHYEDDKQRDCHRAIKTSSYEEYKNINPRSAPGTCRWLLDHPKYRQWRANRECDLLWISADPGCGKSVLSRSLVDQTLRSESNDVDLTICYFFFRDNDVQDGLSVALCAVLHQLFARQPQLIQHAIPAWKKDGNKVTSEYEELWRILLAAMTDRQASPMICVLDALDECRDIDRRRLISMLCQFYNDAARTSSASGKLKFLVTSRPYEDIEYHFGRIAASLPSIRLRGEDKNDQIRREIDSVVRQCVGDMTQEYRLTLVTAEKLERKLLAMENRTYLWLHLAIDSIRQAFSHSLRPDQEAIELLPNSVDDAYEQILSKIGQNQTGQVRKILQIIVSARRPLTTAEMALALGVATSKVTPQSLSDLDIREDQLVLRIRQWCGLFVFINHSQLYLIHQTAKEFLLRDLSQTWIDNGKWKHCLSKTDTECEIARIYIFYLCLEEFGTREATQVDLSVKINASQTTEYEAIHYSHGSLVTDHEQRLFDLAAESWPELWRNIEPTANMITKNKALLLYSMQSPRFSRWTGAMWSAHKPHERNPGMNDLVMAAFNGHLGVIQNLLEDSSRDLDTKDQEGHTALLRAAELGHTDVVLLLLDKGANINVQGGRLGTPLNAASVGGHDQVVQVFIRRGADIEAQGGKALYSASLYGHEKVSLMLVDAGANVDAQGALFEKYANALQAASAGGFEHIVQKLLSAGANVNTQMGSYGNALYAASVSGHSHVVQRLLRAGAHVNAQGGRYGNALQSALVDGHELVVGHLLKAGADVRIQGVKALYTACMYGHEKIVRMLLGVGVNVNARGGLLDKYANALHAASAGGHDQVVRTLIDAGAHVETQGDKALYTASLYGHAKVVRILVEAGADKHAQGGPYGNAIHVAVGAGHDQILQTLIKAGADVKSQGSKLLHTAVIEGHQKVVQVLIDAGVNINIQGGRHGDSLQAAARVGHEEILLLLIKAGADIRSQGDVALYTAAAEGHDKPVQVLIDAGADINAQVGPYGTALQAASYAGHRQVIHILLEAGADVNAQGGIYGRAIQVASMNGHHEIEQILLAAGAENDQESSDESGNEDEELDDHSRSSEVLAQEQLLSTPHHAFFAASASGDTQKLRDLIAAEADFHLRGGKFYSALQAASITGQIEIASVLLGAGSNVNIHGGPYDNALSAASCNGHEQLVAALLEAGADVNCAGRCGHALYGASYHGYFEVVRMLIEAGADVDAQGGPYGSALHAASVHGHIQIAQLLIDAGADINAQGGPYGTALCAATLNGKEEIVQILDNATTGHKFKETSRNDVSQAAVSSQADSMLQALDGDVNEPPPCQSEISQEQTCNPPSSKTEQRGSLMIRVPPPPQGWEHVPIITSATSDIERWVREPPSNSSTPETASPAARKMTAANVDTRSKRAREALSTTSEQQPRKRRRKR